MFVNGGNSPLDISDTLAMDRQDYLAIVRLWEVSRWNVAKDTRNKMYKNIQRDIQTFKKLKYLKNILLLLIIF